MKIIRKEKIKENISVLSKGIYAGIMIGIGGTIYLSVSNQVVGAILFAIGLLTICVYKMNLYTGMIGYILENKLGYLKTLILTLLGNFIGTLITAYLVSNCLLLKPLIGIYYITHRSCKNQGKTINSQFVFTLLYQLQQVPADKKRSNNPKESQDIFAGNTAERHSERHAFIFYEMQLAPIPY